MEITRNDITQVLGMLIRRKPMIRAIMRDKTSMKYEIVEMVLALFIPMRDAPNSAYCSVTYAGKNA